MNHKELVEKLRNTKSESKRKMLDEAADIIEALVADLKQAAHCDTCDICAHSKQEPTCQCCEIFDFECFRCEFDCVCKNCIESSKFEWRGVQKEASKA